MLIEVSGLCSIFLGIYILCHWLVKYVAMRMIYALVLVLIELSVRL